ncbi:TPA: cation:proton antiporter [candidate division WOR-3]|uniref:Cation:proton antiporter n=1 Tax=candidate division WOR-3 bacterium TaxID=2052148 RepID=A0A348MLE3_UNCW3|nr:cation:proton antiporter [candidate division WOR-3 bacterium]HCP17387.1 cation:proton antiporter [candidate division WOR-3 bacterium]
MNTLYIIWFSILGLSVILIIIRFFKGPLVQDRTIALDMFTTITSGGLVLLSSFLQNSYLLDISLVYAILSFVSVIAISKYIEERGSK